MSDGSLTLTRRGWLTAVVGLVVLALGIVAIATRAGDQEPAAAADDPVAPAVDPVGPRASLGTQPAIRWAAASPVTLGSTSVGAPLVLDTALVTWSDLTRLLERAPVVVAASTAQPDALRRATDLALRLQVPLLHGPVGANVAAVESWGEATLAPELLTTWGTEAVVAVGDVRVPPGVRVRRWSNTAPAVPKAIELLLDEVQDRAPAGVVALTRADADPSLMTTAAAAGIEVVSAPDLFALDAADRDRLATSEEVVLMGSPEDWADVDDATLDWHLAVIRSGRELPGGGYRLFPDRRMVALYGHPEGPALGLLGEQPVEEAIDRALEHAEPYAELSDRPVIAAFEIIATIASAGPARTGDYSRRTPIETLRPWVEAAGEAGLYVVLDLQPGRTDFLTQAQEYEELLRLPYVGLALDPEWRLKPNQVHLRQIGSVGIDEVNAVGTWLADLTRDNALPQKLFVLHQFRLDMIRERERLDTSRRELAYLVHVDGQGGQAAKDATYGLLTRTDPPPNLFWGWKNFYDEDVPGLRSPADTLAVTPTPDLITFQ